MMTVEEADALRTLIKTMLRQNYSEYVYRIYAEDVEDINKRVADLIQKNYSIQEFKNSDGALCAHYPPTIFIPWPRTAGSRVSELSSLICQAKAARARTRFVVPAFSFNGKNVCRSSTLSGILEVYGRQFASAAGKTAITDQTVRPPHSRLRIRHSSRIARKPKQNFGSKRKVCSHHLRYFLYVDDEVRFWSH
ncbi:hypothetical protein FBUS_09986 [Fasciolopsis buskii]|uniref:Uncharacterized protein n=1 Tax=Fasciolopsis buskii TaxID=27845 RepID=A0A8E0RKK6_9TREM|nr:hypothetical protein FBUS_09986 [Fasciolopsis buski]